MAGATIVIMLGVLLSRVLGLVRDSVIAHRFGQGYDTDVYNAAFTIPDVIFYLIAGGALSSAFIPVFTEYMERGEKREAWRLFSIVCITTALVVGLFIAAGELFVHPLVKAFNPGPAWGPQKLSDVVVLTRILLPAQVCFFLGGLMMGALQVLRNNMGQAFGPAVYNLGIILGGLFLTQRYGVAGLCWGAVGGAILGNLVLQWVLVRRAGGYFTPSVFRRFHHPGAQQVWNLMWPILLGLALPQVCPIVNKWFATFLKDDGTMSALMNSNRLMQVPLGIFGQACGIAIFPLLAQQAVRGDRAALRMTLSSGLRFILFLIVPSSIYMIVLALPIVQFLYQAGKFTASDAHVTAAILVAYTIGLFAWSAQAVIARGFYALKDSRTPVIIGTLVTVLFVIANAVVLRVVGGAEHSVMGACGLALVTSCAAILNTGVLFWLLRRRLGGIDGARLLAGVLKILVASTVFGIACRATLSFLERHPLNGGHASVKIVSAETLLLCAVAGVLAYAVMAFALRMEETKLVLKLLYRR